MESLRTQLKTAQSETSQLQASHPSAPIPSLTLGGGQVDAMAMQYELDEHRRKAQEAATTLCQDCQAAQRELQAKEKAYLELERSLPAATRRHAPPPWPASELATLLSRLLHTHRSTEEVLRQAAAQAEAEAERKYLLLECEGEKTRRELAESQSALVVAQERLQECLNPSPNPNPNPRTAPGVPRGDHSAATEPAHRGCRSRAAARGRTRSPTEFPWPQILPLLHGRI